jgi:PAS domain S-box-containing protein
VNKLYCEISGYKESELIGKHHTISNDGLYEAEFWEEILEKVRKGNAWRGEVKCRRKNGSIYWTDTLIGPIMNSEGEFENYLTLKFDITEKKNMEEQLSQKNEQLNLLNSKMEEVNAYLATQQNAMESSMLVLKGDQNCNITFANKRVLDLFGFSEAEFLSNCVIIDPAFKENPAQEQIKKLLEKGEIWKGELRSRNKTGEPVWLHLAIAPIFIQDEITSLLMIGFDATARKKMEDRIIRQKQELIKVNQSKDKLFGLVAHDLKSPLASLEGVLELMAAGELTKSETQLLTGKIGEHLGKVNELLTNLLNWSRSQLNGIKVRPSKLSARNIAIDTINLLSEVAAKKAIIIENKISPNLNILADQTMITTVFRNLLVNAIKFSKQGGLIQVSAQEKKETNTIFISDNGLGIDYKHQKKLFTDFTVSREGTTGEIGSGLGLQICKDFLEKNNGTLDFESTPGKGSTFYFELPKFKAGCFQKLVPVAG